MKIAIQPDFLALKNDPQQSFSKRWIELLEQAGHEACLVDVFAPDFFAQIQGCDGFMWWFPPIPFPRDKAKKLIAALGHVQTLPTFPDWRDCWHFDDKVAQSYLFQAAGIPTPRTWVFWREQDAREFCTGAQYPLVIKLSSGVYSQNVRLLRSRAEAKYWIGELFGHGIVSLDRPAGSALKQILIRGRAALRLLARGHGPSIGGLDFHKDYLLVQEFVQGNDYDTRIFVIGNRAFGVRRANRPDDFRASGSGNADRNPTLTDESDVRLAFRVAKALRAQSVCMDILRQDGKPVICEVSYYFEGWSVYDSPGHWALHGSPDTGQLEWVGGKMRGEDALLEDFLVRLASLSPPVAMPVL